MTNWILVTDDLPIDGWEVLTKIDDDDGVRNEQTLVRQAALWFSPDKSMYVYYRPTHWSPVVEELGK